MQDAERMALQASVELLHNCQATFLQEEAVHVTSGSVTIRRQVATFELRGDRSPAPLAYAWTDPLLSDQSVHHQVVLHQGVVKSVQHAVAGFFLTDSPTSPTSTASSGGAPPLWWAESG
jgi:hypothetical protein